MLLELLQKGYGKAMNLNCAEKILYGANWAYNIQLPPACPSRPRPFWPPPETGCRCCLRRGYRCVHGA